MTTINSEFCLQENRRIVSIINDIGELILREDIKLYEEIVMSHFQFQNLSPKEEKEFLYKLYNHLVDKLKELKFN
jgi:hypothetical protein